jgi:hypothetical protein
LQDLLREAFHGAPQGGPSWFLNPGDPGLLGVLASVSAEKASTPPGDGRKPIVSHAAHVTYHLELIERVLGGDSEAFATADWNAAWMVTSIDDAGWVELQERMRKLADAWIAASAGLPTHDRIMLTGSLASATHFGYHLGAIQQIRLSVQAR